MTGACLTGARALQELHLSRRVTSMDSKSLEVSRSSSSSRDSGGGGGGGRREGRGRRLKAVEEGLSDEVERIRRRLEGATRTGSSGASKEIAGYEPPHAC